MAGFTVPATNWRAVEVDQDFFLKSDGDYGGFMELEELDGRAAAAAVEAPSKSAGSNGAVNPEQPVTAPKKKKKKRKGDRVEGFTVPASNWRAVEVDPDFFLKSDGDYGGFLELEELDGPAAAAAVEAPSTSGGSNGAVNHEDSATTPKKKKKKKGKQVTPDTCGGDVEAASIPPSAQVDPRAWKPLGMHKKLLASVAKLGFKTPTPIQERCIPVALSGSADVIGAAQTGSGKTLAFGIPIVHQLLTENGSPSSGTPLRGMIISPTRELALQIQAHIDGIAKRHGVYTACIVGGMSLQKQERVLKRKPHLVVATPGRLWELMQNENEHLSDLSKLGFFVLDEADRMVEQGHYHELSSIMDHIPFSDRLQTFVFSATLTMPKMALRKKAAKPSTRKPKNAIASIMQKIKFRKELKTFDLTSAQRTATSLQESVLHCSEESRLEFLYYILATTEGRTLVFCNTISLIRTLQSILSHLGLPVSAIHAQQQQRQRLKALDGFKSGKKSVLVATDVAARGLDIPDVRCVIQYQLPDSSDTYVHRAGRTARAGMDGLSILFVVPKDAKNYLKLQYAIKNKALVDFPIDLSVMPQVRARVSLAQRIDAILRAEKKAKAKSTWLEKNAEAVGIILDDDDADDDERVRRRGEADKRAAKVSGLQRELLELLSRPLQARFSTNFLAGSAALTTIALAESAHAGKQKLKNALGKGKKRKVTAGEIQERRGPEALAKLKPSASKKRPPKKRRK